MLSFLINRNIYLTAGLLPQHQMCWLVNAVAKKLGLKSYITDLDIDGNMHDIALTHYEFVHDDG